MAGHGLPDTMKAKHSGLALSSLVITLILADSVNTRRQTVVFDLFILNAILHTDFVVYGCLNLYLLQTLIIAYKYLHF